MPPAKITTTERYIHPEVAKVYFLETVAAPLVGPTRLEIDAGHDLTDEIADMPGWMLTPERVAVPDLGRKFVSRVGGRINPSDSQIVFWSSEDTMDIRDLLSDGDAGYIMAAHGGDVAGKKADLWPIKVISLSNPIQVGSESARITVDFAHTAKPLRNFSIPA